MDQDSFDDMKAKMFYNFKIAFDVFRYCWWPSL